MAAKLPVAGAKLSEHSQAQQGLAEQSRQHSDLLPPTPSSSCCTPLLETPLPPHQSLTLFQSLPAAHPPTLSDLDFPVATCSCSTLHPQGSETQRDSPTHTAISRQTGDTDRRADTRAHRNRLPTPTWSHTAVLTDNHRKQTQAELHY